MHSLTPFLLLALLAVPAAHADPMAGAQKSASCAHCHNQDGNALTPIYPILAGQQQAYISKQIRELRDGARKNSIMAPMVGGLTDQEASDLADYYSSQNLSRRPPNVNPEKVARGKQLAKQSDCGTCHQANFKGQGANPRISRQHIPYLTKQMKELRDGIRTNDGGVHARFLEQTSDEDIESLAQYLSSL